LYVDFPCCHFQEEEEARYDADQELLNLKAVSGTENVEGGVVGGVSAAAILYRDALRSLMHQSRLRAVTGKDWEVRMDQKSGCEFYFNTDSGQATWEKPLSVHVRVLVCCRSSRLLCVSVCLSIW
jgi:hypothetical protein